MSYKKYVLKNGTEKATELTKNKDFPRSGDWRELKLFVNSNDVPEDIAAELEQLHDDYHLQRGGRAKWLMYRLKMAIQSLLTRY